ncbi:hypothetical protein BRC66_01875 [Halobacteriales archaeon QH_2_66_30]|nr:MAG: hypothetical protein BRC66_01875 [Halobacteriales archaeon QH_2_66_30]
MDRRHYLAAVGVLLGAGCTSNDSSPDPEPSDEPSDSEGSNGTSDSKSPSERSESLPNTPEWEYDIPDELGSSAVTVGDGVYIVEYGKLIHLSETGGVQWTSDLDWGSSDIAEPKDIIFSGDSVYYSARVSPGTGRLGAHDAGTGDQLWAQDFDINPLNFIEVTEDTVFAGRTSAEEPGRARILNIDASTGDERWRTVTGMTEDATTSHGLLIVYSDVTNTVTALGIDTGDEQWNDSLSPDSSARIFTRGDTFSIAVGFSAFGYSLPDGKTIWHRSLERDWRLAEPAPTDSAYPSDIYVADGGGELRAIDVAAGNERWVIDDTEGEHTAMGVGTNSIFVYYSDGSLISYDMDDGSQRWRSSIPSDYENQHIFLSTDTVFLTSQQFGKETSVQAFDIESGQRRWQTRLSTGEAPPKIRTALDEHVVVVTPDSIYGLPIDEFA